MGKKTKAQLEEEVTTLTESLRRLRAIMNVPDCPHSFGRSWQPITVCECCLRSRENELKNRMAAWKLAAEMWEWSYGVDDESRNEILELMREAKALEAGRMVRASEVSDLDATPKAEDENTSSDT